jgi:3-dehydroquinate dehydratase-2
MQQKDKTMARMIFMLNGPNLNLLGKRQPELYGHDTLHDIARDCDLTADQLGLTLTHLQSNHEGQLIDWIHQAREDAEGIIMNPGAFSHSSIAILDALNMVEGPILEVHISNIHKRESFRHHSYVSLRAEGVIVGFGSHGYQIAVQHMAKLLTA